MIEVLIYHPEISAQAKPGAKSHAQDLDAPHTFFGRPPSGIPYREERAARDLLAMRELCGGCKKRLRRLLRFGEVS